MNKIDMQTLKNKIENHLKHKGLSHVEIILIPGGCLVQSISNAIKESEKIIFDELTKLHRTLENGEYSFPFRIYVYPNADDSFKIEVGLKTNSHNYDSGFLATYRSEEDALVKMREIDVDALLYGVSRPFEFKVKSTDQNFPIKKYILFKELDVAGKHFSLENKEISHVMGDLWKIIL